MRDTPDLQYDLWPLRYSLSLALIVSLLHSETGQHHHDDDDNNNNNKQSQDFFFQAAPQLEVGAEAAMAVVTARKNHLLHVHLRLPPLRQATGAL